jgi:hypothetical protein
LSRAICKRVDGRIHHADVAAARLGLHQREAVGRRHAQGVAVGAQDHALLQGQVDRHVHAADGQHADRAAGAMHHAHRGRQQVGQAVARNGMGMAAAELHEAVAAPGPDFGGDAGAEVLRQLAVAEFVDVFHEAAVSPMVPTR